MAVTRSTAAERRQRETSALQREPGFAVQGLPGAPSRNLERILLAAAAAAVLLGLALAYLAMAKPLEDEVAKLAAGEIVNLNDLRSSDQLLPVLDVFDSSAERAFAAQAIWKRAHQGAFPNVGEIERIRVSSTEIAGDRRLTSLRERLEARRQAGAPQGEISLPLLSLQQLRAVKPAGGCDVGHVPASVVSASSRGIIAVDDPMHMKTPRRMRSSGALQLRG